MGEVYGYIPLPSREWKPSFGVAFAHLKPMALFLDVGAGVGTKVLRACHAGLNAYGIEINPRYQKIAQKLGASVLEADARIWDQYAIYDCVFMFHLLQDVEEEIALEHKIMSMMKSGAILILYGAVPWELDRDWEVLGEHCWRKP